MSEFIEKKTFVTENDEKMTHYVIYKSPIAFDELKNLPKTVLSYYEKERTIREEYVCCRLSSDRKNVFVGIKRIQLKKLGSNFAPKAQWDNYFSLINGTIHGNGYRVDDNIMKAFLMELGLENLAIPLGENNDKPHYNQILRLVNKQIIKQILSGKIRTREELLLANFKTKYGITTVRPSTIEKWITTADCDNISGITTIKAVVAPEKIDLTLRKALKMKFEETVLFNKVTQMARDLDCNIDPEEDTFQRFITCKRLAAKKIDTLAQYGVLDLVKDEQVQFSYTATLANMTPITSEIEKLKICEAHNIYEGHINLSESNTVFFLYKKDSEESIIEISKPNNKNDLVTCIRNGYGFNCPNRELIQRQVKKNTKEILKMLASKISNPKPEPEPKPLNPEDDYPF